MSWVATASLSTVESSAHRHPHRSLPHRATPATVYPARPKANPGTRTDTHDRVDRVDEAGSVTLRMAGRLHHIGVGRAHARTRVLILIHDLNIRIINATTSGLLRYLILDPTCHYQPTGNPKGPVPAKTVSMRQRDPQMPSLGHGGATPRRNVSLRSARTRGARGRGGSCGASAARTTHA